jgi:hypothetical protein
MKEDEGDSLCFYGRGWLRRMGGGEVEQSFSAGSCGKEMLLPEEYRTKTIQTLRWSLIGIEGKAVRHGSPQDPVERLLLLLATTWGKYAVYFQMRKRCMTFT